MPYVSDTHKAIEVILASDAVRSDAVAQRIVSGLEHCETVEDVLTLLKRLTDRVSEIEQRLARVHPLAACSSRHGRVTIRL